MSLKLGSDLLGRLAQLALIVVAARSLTPADFGDYAFAVAVGFILSQLSDFGLQLFLFRALSAAGSPTQAARLLGESLAARVTLAVLASALGLLVVALVSRPLVIRGAITGLILATIVGSLADTLYYVFRAYGRIAYEAAVSLAGRLLLLGLGGSALLLGLGLTGLALAHVVMAVVTVSSAFFLLRWRILRPAWPISTRPMLVAVRRAAPIGAGIAASLLYFKSDVVLLQWLRGPEEVAVYSAAYKLFEPTLMVPAAVLAATFPYLARAAGHFGQFLSYGARLLLGLGSMALAVTVVGSGLAPWLVLLLYGQGYVGSVDLLRVLLLATVPMFVNYGLTHGFIGLDRAWYNAVFAAMALVVNLGANLLLIPTSGAVGAAIATVLTEVVLLVLCSLGLAREWSLRRTALARGNDGA